MTKPELKKIKIDLGKAKLPTLKASLAAGPTPDPLAGVTYGQSIEEDAAAETSALLEAFRDRARQEQERFTLATDSEFWFSLGFQSREQKEAFLIAMNWLTEGDKYLDGTAVARKMNIKLPAVTLSQTRRVDRRLRELTNEE